MGVTLVLLALPGKLRGDEYRWETIAGSNLGAGKNDGTLAEARIAYATDSEPSPDGGIIFVDSGNHTVRRISPEGIVSTVAGKAGVSGVADGPGSEARFSFPWGVAVSPDGVIFVSEGNRHTIRKISPEGIVTTVAGRAGLSGFVDGGSDTSRLNSPQGITFGSAGDLYIADSGNSAIRRLDADGTLVTVAGAPTRSGHLDGAGEVARFSYPVDVEMDGNGGLLVADSGNAALRRVAGDGRVTTVAGRPGIYGKHDGPALEATFGQVTGLAVAADGSVFISDGSSATLRKLSAAGTVETVAGAFEQYGITDGERGLSRLFAPAGLSVSADGSVIIADDGAAALRSLDANGVVRTLLGGLNDSGFQDGTGDMARFNRPAGMALAADGSVLVADKDNHVIRIVDSLGITRTYSGSPGNAGYQTGTALEARYTLPVSIASDGSGNLYVLQGTGSVRKVAPDGTVAFSHSVGGIWRIALAADGALFGTDNYGVFAQGIPGRAGFYAGQRPRSGTAPNGTPYLIYPTGIKDGPKDQALFLTPQGLAYDNRSAFLYVADTGNHAIRKLDRNGNTTTLVGKVTNPAPSGTVDGYGPEARMSSPDSLAISPKGYLFVTETGSHVIRRVSPQGRVRTIGGEPGYRGTGEGVGGGAQFHTPGGIIVAADGSVYVSDTGNNRIMKGTPIPSPELGLSLKSGPALENGGTVDFGDHASGQEAKEETLVFSNDGSMPVRITGLIMSDPDSAGGIRLGTETVPETLGGHSSWEIPLSFTRNRLGSHSAALVILTDDPSNGVIVVLMQGSGVNSAPVLGGNVADIVNDGGGAIPLSAQLVDARDPDGDALRIEPLAGTSGRGFPITEGDGSLIYGVEAGYTGMDLIRVRVSDPYGGVTEGFVFLWITGEDRKAYLTESSPDIISYAPNYSLLTMQAKPLETLIVEISEDLVRWTEISRSAADLSGFFHHVDTETRTERQLFYRVRQPD